MVAIIAIMPNIKPVNKTSGSLKNLNLAVLDSKIATPTINARIFTIRIIKEKIIALRLRLFAIPQGKNMFTPNIANITNLFAAAHSISAKRLPEYSKIIAS